MYIGGSADENNDYFARLHEEDKEIQHRQIRPTWGLVMGADSKVHLRHRSGPLEAQEEVAQCKTEVEDER